MTIQLALVAGFAAISAAQVGYVSGHCNSLPCYGANHSTIGSQSVSFLDVLANIKAGQPIPSAN